MTGRWARGTRGKRERRRDSFSREAEARDDGTTSPASFRLSFGAVASDLTGDAPARVTRERRTVDSLDDYQYITAVSPDAPAQ